MQVSSSLDLDAHNRVEVLLRMSKRILDNLRRQKKCIERAIRALEELEKLEREPGFESSARGIDDAKVIEIPRRPLRA